MKLLKEDTIKLNKVIFDQADADYISKFTQPFATCIKSPASERWNEVEGESLRIVGNSNEWVNIGGLNVTKELSNKIFSYIKQKYGDVDVHNNNDATIYWAYKE